MNSKPTNAVELRIELQVSMINTHVWQCCTNCLYWDGKQCDKFKAVPPPHIIVASCKDYENDIPF